MKLAVTGHRPEKLPSDLTALTSIIERMIVNLNPEETYVGMAAGVDLLVAEICVRNNLPYVACRPWSGHTARKGEEHLYNIIVENAVRVVEVTPVFTYPGPEVYMKRNKFMVDNADALLSVWDGEKQGGTWQATSYAMRQNKPVYHIDPTSFGSKTIGDLPLFT